MQNKVIHLTRINCSNPEVCCLDLALSALRVAMRVSLITGSLSLLWELPDLLCEV